MSGDAELVTFLQRAAGYSLTGSTREQCLFVLYGTGANGKSSLLDTLRLLLGDYAQQTESKTFTEKKQDSISNDIARLKGARLVAASETESGGRLAESLVKQMTGGEPLTARFLHQEFFEFRPEFKVWLGTNHKPVIKGSDNAIWRRIRLIPFDVTIPPAERDKDLLFKLREELPGILAWAVRGCADWLRNGLSEPESVMSATSAYRDEMDVLGPFFSECCHFTHIAKTSASELYRAYGGWVERFGEKPMSQRSFGMSLSERGLSRSKNSAGLVFWSGIGLGKEDYGGTEEESTKIHFARIPGDPRPPISGETPPEGQNPPFLRTSSGEGFSDPCPRCHGLEFRASKTGRPICVGCWGPESVQVPS